jgi:type I restriction enzyme, S subunit
LGISTYRRDRATNRRSQHWWRVYSVLSCTKHQGLVESLKYFGRQVFSADTAAYKIVERGQFAYATNHLEEGSIGYLDFRDKGLVSPMYTVFKTDSSKVNDRFLWKLFKTSVYLHIFQVNTSSSVDRRGGLRWDEFGKLRVPLPTIAEQAEIDFVLSLAQREIDLLKTKRNLLEQEKRGLMQKLLTGEWRVPVRDSDVDAIAARVIEQAAP